jgi:SAM-dependent methyltransferase
VLGLAVRDQVRAIGRPLEPGSRILDLGAGDGRLAAALASRGHAVTAVEPVRDVAGAPAVNVVRSSVEELDLPEGSFDVAILWHVLEHLSAPAETLGRIRGWLAPGGRLVVAVPNLASWQARLGGRRWFHLDPARHVVHFTPAGLDALFTRAGFAKPTRRRVFVDQALPGMWMTLLDRTSGRAGALRSAIRREPVRGSDVAVAAVVAAPALAAAIPAELVATALGRGGVIVVTARPR